MADLGGGLVGFSPLSGRSLLLNAESAALLEILAGSTGMAEEELAHHLHEMFETVPEDVLDLVSQACVMLESHGLLLRLPGDKG